MRAHSTYRHPSCLDIDLFVRKVAFIGANYVKVKGSLINRFNGIVYENKTYTIAKSSLSMWRLV